MDSSILSKFQCTGDQVRIAYEMVFEKELGELTYEQALSELVEKYGFAKIHEVVHAVLQDKYVQEGNPPKSVWKTFSEEEKRSSIEELIDNL